MFLSNTWTPVVTVWQCYFDNRAIFICISGTKSPNFIWHYHYLLSFSGTWKHLVTEGRATVTGAVTIHVQHSSKVSPSGSALPSLSGMVKTPTMVWPSRLSSLYTSCPNRLWPITAIFILTPHFVLGAITHRKQVKNIVTLYTQQTSLL